MTVSSVTKNGLVTATCGQDLNWNLLLALPPASLSTKKARALLPAHYSREDAVANIQATALLVAAFAQGRSDLLRTAMQDRLHQPYRAKACPLLPLLLPLTEMAEDTGILGVALSGAGPSVLLITGNPAPATVDDRIRQAAHDPTLEIIHTTISTGVLQT
jgi:homoserine kinase